jgi:hypothetical protein
LGLAKAFEALGLEKKQDKTEPGLSQSRGLQQEWITQSLSQVLPGNESSPCSPTFAVGFLQEEVVGVLQKPRGKLSCWL